MTLENATHVPFFGFQNLTVLSLDTEARRGLSDESATVSTISEWPFRMPCNPPVFASQSPTVLSSDAEARSWPSNEKASAPTELEWPSSVCREELQSFGTFGSVQIQSEI
jgi:hypothetical protein